MIPFAALAGLIGTEAGQTEFSVLKLSAEGFAFRLPAESAEEVKRGVTKLELRYHRLHDTLRWTMEGDCALRPAEAESGAQVFRAECAGGAWHTFAMTFMRDSVSYTALKTAGDDAAAAHALVGYDAAGEERFAADLPHQLRAWYGGLRPDDGYAAAAQTIREAAVRLDSPGVIRSFLSVGAGSFRERYWAERGLAAHPLAGLPFSRVYAGSPFCAERLPDADTLAALRDHAERQGIALTLTLPPLPEHALAKAERLAGVLPGDAEIEVNDWGAAARLGGRHPLEAGVLLLRRRKDTRMPLMRFDAEESAMIRSTAAEAPWYAGWLRELGFRRVLLESGADPGRQLLPCDVVLPFRQMNTATRCTLRAVCEHGDRGAPLTSGPCPQWCDSHCFLYPEGLGMIGSGNSLLAFDRAVAESSDELRRSTAGCGRVLFNPV